MKWQEFNTTATQLGDGARVDVKIKGKEYKNARVGYLYGMPTIYFDDGSSFWCIDDKAAAMVQELIIHSPEPMKTVVKIESTVGTHGDMKLTIGKDKLILDGVEYVRKEEKKVQKQWRDDNELRIDTHEEDIAFANILCALKYMWKAEKTRALSVAITNLETAMMWLNKDRANKGLIPKTNTHIK